jgi:hypothetical protein
MSELARVLLNKSVRAETNSRRISMTILKTAAALAALGTAIAAAAPASAVVTTFATFSSPTTAANFRFVNSGNSSSVSRTTDATLYTTSTPTGNAPGAVIVRFSFLQPQFAAYVTDIKAKYTYNATIKRGTPAVAAFGALVQQGIKGTFSFLTTTAITVSGPYFIPHTFAAGSNLLSGSFSSSTLFGAGSSASTSSSTLAGSTVVFTSDFLDFSGTVNRDRSLALTSIIPALSKHAGLNGALSSFRASSGGQFSSDPAPIITGLAIVPEPAVWGMLIVGFGMVGVQTRRRSRSTSVTA